MVRSGSGPRSTAVARPTAPAFVSPLRPEQEGRFALHEHEFGLDVMAPVGTLRHAQHRGDPEIRAEMIRRGVPACFRTAPNLPDRHEELLALSLPGTERLRRVTGPAGRVILAIDGLQPGVQDLKMAYLRLDSIVHALGLGRKSFGLSGIGIANAGFVLQVAGVRIANPAPHLLPRPGCLDRLRNRPHWRPPTRPLE